MYVYLIHIGRSPGYALSLLAESTTGAMHSAEAVSQPGVTPEDIALLASRSLLSEVRKGGCVDRQHQVLVLLMMVLGSEDVGRCLMGEPTTRTYVFKPHSRALFPNALPIVCNSSVTCSKRLEYRSRSLLATRPHRSYYFPAMVQGISIQTGPWLKP